jgi:ribosomal protein S12 methylthiotransferase accessory factor
MDDIEVSFPGGKRVDARVGAYVVRTDQPAEVGGEGKEPAPFDLFLASIATCAGIYVLGFCQARGLSTEGLRLRQHVDLDPTTKLPARVRLELTLPPGFPEQYRTAIVKGAEACKIRRTLAAAPAMEVVLAPSRPEAPRGTTNGAHDSTAKRP